MKLVILGILFALNLGSSVSSQTGDRFAERLEKNRYPLVIENGQLAGTGAPVLTSALAQAQFILVGEDQHGIAQVPALWSVICRVAVPAGFDTMAIETGPLAATELQEWVRQSNGEAQVARFEKEHPDSIAFYNLKQEFEMLQQCSHLASSGEFHLWGLDQEFFGSAGWILERVLDTNVGPESHAAIEELLKKSTTARARAEQSGRTADLYLLSATDDDLSKAASALKKDGNARAQSLFDGFVQSHNIYTEYTRGSNYASNRARARLMKKTFAALFTPSSRRAPQLPKVLVKMGGNHLYRGPNPLHSSEIGDYIAEMSEGQGTRSVHILVLGVKGSQLRYTKVGAPYAPGLFDLTEEQSDAFMRPMFDKLLVTGWTMCDLRELRDGFDLLGSIGGEVERLVFGYDFLILIPEVTPSVQIR